MTSMHAVVRKADLAKLVKAVKSIDGDDLSITMLRDAWRMCIASTNHTAMVIADLFPGVNISDYSIQVDGGDQLDIVLPLVKVSVVLDIMDSEEITLDYRDGSVTFSADGISKSIRTGGIVETLRIPDPSGWPTVAVQPDISKASRVVRKSLSVSDVVRIEVNPERTVFSIRGDVEGVEVSDVDAVSGDGNTYVSTFAADYTNEALNLFADGPALIHMGTDLPLRVVRTDPFPLTYILAPYVVGGE